MPPSPPPLQYCCFLHAGFAWNRLISLDMLGLGPGPHQQLSSADPLKPNTRDAILDASILREVASLIIFSTQTEQDKHASGIYSAVLSLLTGEFLISEIAPTGAAVAGGGGSGSSGQASGVSAPAGLGDVGVSSGNDVSPRDLAAVEAILWSLVASPSSVFVSAAAPSKDGTAKCLRFYRRLLLNVKYRVGAQNLSSAQQVPVSTAPIIAPATTAPKRTFLQNWTGYGGDSGAARTEKVQTSLEQEFEELFAVLHLLSILCRAIVLSYNALEKKAGAFTAEELSFSALLDCLPLGTKSDIANLLLESLEHFSNVLKKRFDRLSFTTVDVAGTSSIRNSSHLVSNFKRRFLLQSSPQVPILAIVRAMNNQEKLSLQSAEETLLRLFPSSVSSLL